MPPVLVDRRASPRLYVDNCLGGQVLGSPVDVVSVRDFALDGFSVESLQPGVSGRRDEVRFVTDGGLAVRVRAEVVYSRPVEGAACRYVNGYRFIADDQAAEASIDLLVESVTSPILFD